MATEFVLPTTPELTARKEYAIVRDTLLPHPFSSNGIRHCSLLSKEDRS